MKEVYVKAALYSYTEIDKCIKLIEQGMMRKALSSRNDTRYALVVYDELVDKYIMRKVNLMKFKEHMMKALSHMSKMDMYLLDYKYFGDKSVANKAWFVVDKEEQILNTFAGYLEKEGVTDEWFKNEGRNFINIFVHKARKKESNKDISLKSPNRYGFIVLEGRA